VGNITSLEVDANLLQNPTVKEFWKSVNICKRYATVFWHSANLTYRRNTRHLREIPTGSPVWVR